MRVNMYMQIYNECEKRTEKEETVSHTSRQDYIRSYQQRKCAKTQHANEGKERKRKRKRQSALLSCVIQTIKLKTKANAKTTTLIPTFQNTDN